MEIDFNGAAWVQVVAWAQQRIEQLRKLNDGDLDPLKTAAVRGEIKAYKSLLALPEQAARAQETGQA